MQGGVQTSSRLVGGPSGEWLSPVAAALVNDSQSADMWLEGPPNSPVGLGSQAVCVPFISVTCEIPRSPSGWSESETARVWLECISQHSGSWEALEWSSWGVGGGLFLGHVTQVRDSSWRKVSLGLALGGSAFSSTDGCLLRPSRPVLGGSASCSPGPEK